MTDFLGIALRRMSVKRAEVTVQGRARAAISACARRLVLAWSSAEDAPANGKLSRYAEILKGLPAL